MKLSVILIILVAISLVIGPMMMMRPNPAQQRKERWRQQVRAKGIHVSLRKLPGDTDVQSLPLAMYFMAPTAQALEGNWVLLRASFKHDLHVQKEWAWWGDNRASDKELSVLNQLLPGLPASVQAVSGGAQGAAVYWGEVGDEAGLDAVIALLEALSADAKPI